MRATLSIATFALQKLNAVFTEINNYGILRKNTLIHEDLDHFPSFRSSVYGLGADLTFCKHFVNIELIIYFM